MFTTRFTLAAALILVAGRAAAQSGANASNNHWSGARADELIAQAEQIQNLDSLNVKAKLLEQAVGFMTVDDPRRPTTLLMAGSANFYAGNRRRALELFERAAAVSEEQKNSSVAADAYYPLLVLAAQENRREDARRVIDRMVQLAGAPDLSDDERTSIWRRIAIQVTALVVPPVR